MYSESDSDSEDEKDIVVCGRKTAFKCRLSTYALKNNVHDNLLSFLQDASVLFISETKKLLGKYPVMKINACLEAKFKKGINLDNDEFAYATMYIQTRNRKVDCSTKLSKFYTKNIQRKIFEQFGEMTEQGSGWSLHEIIALVINNNKHQVFNGASHVSLPEFIERKKAVINVQNNDNQCFKWAVLAALHPEVKRPQRVSSYKSFENELNFKNISFPVTLDQLGIFEKNNETISVNIYAVEDEYNHDTKKKENTIVPIRITENVRKNHIHLLWIADINSMENNENEGEAPSGNISLCEMVNDVDVISHYCYIKNLARLVGSQCNSHGHKIWLCDRCLHYFYSEIKLAEHTIECGEKNKCKITLPDHNSNQRWISFKHFNRQLPVPYIIYADIESLLSTISSDTTTDEKCVPKGAYQKHIPISIGYYLHYKYDIMKSKYKTYTGSDCVDWFVNELYDISMHVASEIRQVTKMILSQSEETIFQNAQICHICHTEFDIIDQKVRDHSHLTGAFRGAAHIGCNLQYQEPRLLPVVFHNLNYDSHFLIEKISSAFAGKINIIPINNEHYISFTKEVDNSIVDCENHNQRSNKKINIRFIDSYRFLPSSLQKLASYLPKERLIITKQEWKQLPPEKFSLLTEKGVYPYDYMDSIEKLDEQSLPPKSAFYNKLNDSHITEDEYLHAQRVWNTFDIKNMNEYTNIYLKTDVLLLADVFENFRNSSLNLYGLDPAHYYTTPGLSWDAMLKHTKVRLEVLTDIDMLLFVEKGIKIEWFLCSNTYIITKLHFISSFFNFKLGLRGGVSQCSQRYSKANNKYMTDYDSNRSSSYLMYFDVNNLYGFAMTQSLPRSNFEWVTKGVTEILDTADDAEYGYLIEVDLDYPKELHDKHNDYPLCPEHMKPPNSKHTKLILNLYNKSNYVLHYRTLKFAIKSGMHLKKVGRILMFRQSKWLEPYVSLNTNERTKATNEFEKNFFKLMSNAVYGKTLENVRDRVDISLRTTWLGRYGIRNMIVKPNFKKRVIFNENLAAIEMHRTNIFIAKPIIVGVCVLEISKLSMYDFHYGFMLNKFDHECCKLQYTDTDSFIYNIECDDIYELIKENNHRFDTSDYEPDNEYGIELINKKIPGLMKDEVNGKRISEFVGLRSKMYSVRIDGIDAIKKAKGVKQNVLRKKIHFDNFLECLNAQYNLVETQNTIKSKLHKVYSINQVKSMLDPFDDKRSISEDKINTTAWGHYSLSM